MSKSNEIGYHSFFWPHLVAILFHISVAITFIYALVVKENRSAKEGIFFYFMAISLLIVSVLSFVPIVQQPRANVVIN